MRRHRQRKHDVQHRRCTGSRIAGRTPPNVTYTPAGNYYGADAFTFRAGDGSLSSNIATVSITVTPVNDPPVANPDGPVPVMIGATQFVNVLANDTDVDGNALTIASVRRGGPRRGGHRDEWRSDRGQLHGERHVRRDRHLHLTISDGRVERPRQAWRSRRSSASTGC